MAEPRASQAKQGAGEVRDTHREEASWLQASLPSAGAPLGNTDCGLVDNGQVTWDVGCTIHTVWCAKDF